MTDTLFTTDQLVVLREIERKRVKNGETGLRGYLQELIERLTSGGVIVNSVDQRIVQAKRLLDIGVGKALGFANFESYLATIPEIPEALRGEDSEFPYLVLVPGRMSLTKLCELANVRMLVSENDLVSYDDRHADFTTATWIRIQDGRKNHSKIVRLCRTEFESYELGLTAFQGVSAVIQHSTLVANWNGSEGTTHVMDLPGSVDHGHRNDAACLSRDGGRLELHWHFDDYANEDHGASSRRE